jgi:hypothetical protein
MLGARIERLVLALTLLVAIFAGLSCLSDAEAGSSAQPDVKQKDVPAEWAGVYVDEYGFSDPSGLKPLFPYDLLDEEVPKHLQPWALAKIPVTSWNWERESFCKLSGISRHTTFGGTIKLIPSPGKLTTIANQIELAGVRRIHLDRGHPKKLTPTWIGDSVAHWDGDTLVIDTIGITDKSWIDSDRAPHSNALHLTERMRLVLGGTYLENETLVEDPIALTSSYKYRRYYRKLPLYGEMRENVCNENTGPWKRQREANDQAAAAAAALAAANNRTNK